MKIIITSEVNKKLEHFVDLCPGEVSGIGKSHIEDGCIVFDDIILLKQTCTGTTTDIDDEAMALAMFEMMQSDSSPEEWNIWWHSHVNMAVFWSATDIKTIKDHGKTQSHLVSVVTNKKREFKSRLDLFPKDTSGYNIPLTHEMELETEIEMEPDIEIMWADLSEAKQDELAGCFTANELLAPLAYIPAKATDKDMEILNFCDKEVKEKVTNKIFGQPKYQHGFNNPNGLSKKQLKKIRYEHNKRAKKWWQEDEFTENHSHSLLPKEDVDEEEFDDFDRQIVKKFPGPNKPAGGALAPLKKPNGFTEDDKEFYNGLIR